MAYSGYDMYNMLSAIMAPLMMLFQFIIMFQLFGVIINMLPQLIHQISGSLGQVSGSS